MSESSWSHITFTELFKHSPKEAFEYRERIFGTPMPVEFLEVKPEVIEETKYDRTELAQILRDGGVKFFSGATPKKLLQLCIDNNLI